MNRLVMRSTLACMVLVGLLSGCGLGSGPVYSMDQTDSAHAGYRRSTATSGGNVFVNDFEESSLRLANYDPKQVVGRTSFGGGKICAIEGQSPTAYIAVDVGSEMPAYAVYRAERQLPFDWRQATFQKMRLAVPDGPAANKETTDPAVIQDVVATLRDGAPATPFTIQTAATGLGPVNSVMLWSDQLPGLVFSPQVYFDPAGRVYLAENLTAIEYHGADQTIRASWTPASDSFTQWAKTGD